MRPEAIELYNLLTAEWNKKPQNLDKCLDLLNRLKVVKIITQNYFFFGNLFNLNKKLRLFQLKWDLYRLKVPKLIPKNFIWLVNITLKIE